MTVRITIIGRSGYGIGWQSWMLRFLWTYSLTHSCPTTSYVELHITRTLHFAYRRRRGTSCSSARPDLAAELTAEEVARRWLSVYTPKHLNDAGEKVYEVCKEDVRAITSDEKRVELLRARLSSLSWFMKALNEPIARRVNKEDGVSGRFWGGRFKSQCLVDESGILACMCYVDLNLVRAKLADSLEDSVFTGVYDRIMGEKAVQRQQELEAKKASFSPEKYEEELQRLIDLKKRRELLVDLDGEETPFARINKQEYLQIVDFTLLRASHYDG